MLDKLQRSLDAGQHYEAQQMLKTVYHRFRARKQLQEAYQLLQVLPSCVQIPDVGQRTTW